MTEPGDDVNEPSLPDDEVAEATTRADRPSDPQPSDDSPGADVPAADVPVVAAVAADGLDADLLGADPLGPVAVAPTSEPADAAVAAVQPEPLAGAAAPLGGRAAAKAAKAAERDAAKAAKAAAADQPKRVSSYRKRRSWPQRLLLVFNLLIVVLCFGTAAGLAVGRRIGNSITKITIPATTPNTVGVASSGASGTTGTTGTTLAGATTAATTAGPVETFPPVDPKAQNFLITGADNGSCVDPNSPYAGAFGDRSGMGERSDTIMVMRVDPSRNLAAILSFPRDLFVTIHGGGKSRINAAYVKNDPTKLILTLKDNFGIQIDHFIQIDFCAFKTIIDAIPGGVGVPFEFPARDNNTGLYVEQPGCYYFHGDDGLAYVRSRHYQWYENNHWHPEGLSDLARISRQQDFIRRVIQTALNKGLLTPSILRGLINAATKNVVVDDPLTVQNMLSFAGALRTVQAAGIPSYQIEAVGKNVAGADVLIYNPTPNMLSVLKVFKGQAPLSEAPVQVITATTEAGASSVPDTGVAVTDTTPVSSTTSTTVPVGPTTTVNAPTENNKGIVPPRDVVCP